MRVEWILAAALVAPPVLQNQAARPTTLTHLDTGTLSGVPTLLSWSDDGKQLYLETAERDADGKVTKTHSFVLTVANPVLEPIAAAPGWAARYWSWKSYKTPPDAQEPEILVSYEKRTAMATESAMGGSGSEGGGTLDAPGNASGSSVGSVINRAQQQVKVPVVVLKFKGEVVGEFVNTPPVPGLTFGWAPAMPARLAYATKIGRLAILDSRGKKTEIGGTKNVSLPAWSIDSSTIAFLSMTGKNKYDICVVDVR